MKNCHVPHGSLNFELRTLNFDLRSLMSDSELILYSVTDFRPLRTWVDIISRLTLQRYNILPPLVKRLFGIGGDLTFG